MNKLTVITNKLGAVVGTQIGHGDSPDPSTGIKAAVTAGPDQTIHKIEYEVPLLRTKADIEEFHRKLGKHLKSQQQRSK